MILLKIRSLTYEGLAIRIVMCMCLLISNLSIEHKSRHKSNAMNVFHVEHKNIKKNLSSRQNQSSPSFHLTFYLNGMTKPLPIRIVTPISRPQTDRPTTYTHVHNLNFNNNWRNFSCLWFCRLRIFYFGHPHHKYITQVLALWLSIAKLFKNQ